MRASLTFKTRNIAEDPLSKLYVEIADKFSPCLKNSLVYSKTSIKPQRTNTLQHVDISFNMLIFLVFPPTTLAKQDYC